MPVARLAQGQTARPLAVLGGRSYVDGRNDLEPPQSKCAGGEDTAMTSKMRRAGVASALVAALALAAPAAEAHPHVWVKVKTKVEYDKGTISGISHTWTFDDMYTEMAVQGLDKDGDGAFSREELAELAKVNMDGLKEFAYFTHARLGDSELTFKDPDGGWLEHKDNVMSLHFTLPLDKPVLAEAEGFSFAVYDETFFIAFDLEKDKPVELGAGAPEGCTATVAKPEGNDVQALQELSRSLNGEPTAGNANQGMGMDYSQTVTVGCKKS